MMYNLALLPSGHKVLSELRKAASDLALYTDNSHIFLGVESVF